MKILTQSLLLTVAFCVTTVATADTADFDVLKTMSVADFRATGLDKLSDTQIKALDSWFATYQRQHAPACGTASAPVAATPAVQAEAPVDDSISAYLVGDFRGWSGSTTFHLDNGQVWEQVDDGVVTIGSRQHAKVTITRGAFNAYYMSVEGVTDTVQVRRIKP